nr:RNA-directed DNA polymerase, eukaryota [Tanacetum cinerariifolium]
RDYLKRLATLEEIKEAGWDCGSSKAPGPDGFSFTFVKKYWDIIQKDMFDFINSFFVSSEMPHGSNSTFFTLIPKVNNPTLITDFRPISLIGTHYKIIAKILANRMALKRNKQLLIFKVGFEKAFDFISWRYLDHILDSLGFGYTWRSWIKSCLSSSRAIILVNGSPTSEFSINRGLRQGDPLSPFLFILVMEGLHNAFIEAMSNGLISGININNSTINISHLIFADDVIITTGWNARDLEKIICVLHVFYLVSGLKINIHKSNIYGIGVNEEEVYNMSSNAGCTAALKLLTLLFYKNDAGECSLLQMIFGSRSLKLFMAMKVVSIITDVASRIFGLTLLDLQTSFTQNVSLCLTLFVLKLVVGLVYVFGRISSEDTCVWSLGPKGTFTVKDARNLIDQKSLPSLPSTTWEKSIPRKVNIFIWRLSLDRLPHRLNLSLHGMDIPTISCSSCNANVESANHIFFECTIASHMWKLMYRWCDIPFVQALSFEAFKDWFSSWHASKDKKHKLYVISAS